MEPEMKRTLIAAAGFALFATSGLASAASWSVIVQPGVYGRVAIGGYVEAPQVYAPQPVVAIDNGYGQVVEEYVDPAYATEQTPVYLWVPEYQRLHWAQYCREYGAYGVPVYFVDDGWYRTNVLRRNWTPEQRSWSQQQWLDEDRRARDRFERQRFENQRYEQRQHWNEQREWQERQQQQRRQHDDQDRMRWGSGHAYIPFPQQNGQPSQSQPGGQWQQHGGQWQQPGGQWQQPGNGGNGGHHGGNSSGNDGNNGNAGYGGHQGGNQPGNGGSNGGGNSGTPGNGGHPGGNQPGNGGSNGGNAGNGSNPGNGGNGGNAGSVGHQGGNQAGNGGNYAGNGGNGGRGGNVGAPQPQPPSAQQPYGPGRGAPTQNVGDRRSDERGQDRGDRRGQGEAHGAFEHGRNGNRDR
jgi:hypothetical protein